MKRTEHKMAGAATEAAVGAALEAAAQAAGGVEVLEPVPAPFFGPNVVVDPDDWVTVNRLDERSKGWVLQFKLTPEETSETYIQELRGGGRYRVRLESRDELGH